MIDKKNRFARQNGFGGQNIKNRAFGKMLFLCAALFFTVVVFTQCDWPGQVEFVDVHVYNKTGEDLDVANGQIFVSVIIPAGTHKTIPIIKDKPVSALGKTSGKRYQTRRFYHNNESWIVNP